jgi:hypothetical protein
MSDRAWTYPPELLDAVANFGLAPGPETPPRVVRDQLNELYRYEIRRLRDQLRAGLVEKADYVGLVIVLRKKYWPLSLQPHDWDKICGEPRNPGT